VVEDGVGRLVGGVGFAIDRPMPVRRNERALRVAGATGFAADGVGVSARVQEGAGRERRHREWVRRRSPQARFPGDGDGEQCGSQTGTDQEPTASGTPDRGSWRVVHRKYSGASTGLALVRQSYPRQKWK
jgi:hypothetical protein